jgi:LysM repeat protein
MSIAAELPAGAVTRDRTLGCAPTGRVPDQGRRCRLDAPTPTALLVPRPRIVAMGVAISLPTDPGGGARPTDSPVVAVHRASAGAIAPRAGSVTGFAPGRSVRLTRLGRLMVGLVAAVLGLTVFAAAAAVAARHGRPAPALPSSGPVTVVVQPGETLWTIARRVAPARDPREVVADLRRLNVLPTADIRAGQQLRIRGP